MPARDPTQALLDAAVAPVLARVRAHRDLFLYPARALLGYLERHVYDADLNVERWLEACGASSQSVREAVQRGVGCTLGEYLEQLRTETAMRLLLASDELPLAQVGSLVGYESAERFYDVFRRRCRQTPAVYRRRVREVRARGAEMPDPVWIRPEWRAQLRGGTLAAGEEEAALAGLGAAYGLPVEVAAEAFGGDLESWLTEVCGRYLAGLPPAEQSRQEMTELGFETPELCELLFRKSREEGRDDPPRGIAVAELALDRAQALAPRLDEVEGEHLVARAWACLGNARRIALDRTGAEEAFSTAEKMLTSQPPQPELRAEVLYLESLLRCDERRLPEALELVERALDVCPADAPLLRAEILMGKGSVFAQRFEPERARKCFLAAWTALDASEELYLACTAANNLAITLCAEGCLQEAVLWHERAIALARRLPQRSPVCHQHWVGGLISARLRRFVQAEEKLRKAREGFLTAGRWDYAAVVALDLAHLAARLHQPEAVGLWVGEALPRLEVLMLTRDGVAALGLLRQAIEDGRVAPAVIARFRKHVAWITGSPEI